MRKLRCIWVEEYIKTLGTVTENAIDAVIIDRDTGHVHTVRYGAGIDRDL